MALLKNILAARMFGRTDGAAVPAGRVGEILTGSLSNTALTSPNAADFGSISLTAGVWLVYAHVYFNVSGTAVVSQAVASISSTPGGTLQAESFSAVGSSPAGVDLSVFAMRYVILPSTTTYYLVALCNYTPGTVTADAASSRFYAVRIA